MKSAVFRKRRLKDFIFYMCLLVVPLTQFCIFYIGVNVNSILLAFQTFNRNTGGYDFIGFDNFRRIYTTLTDSTVLTIALKNSLIAYFSGLLVGVTLALLFSFYVYKKKFGYKFFKVVLFMPSIISTIAMVIMFKYFTEQAIPGLLRTVFKVNAQGLLSNSSTTFGTLVFYSIWIGFGTSILMYTGAMSNISESVVESAHIEGATLAQEFFRITLPLIWPTLTTFLMVGVAGIFTNQLNLYSFYGARAEPRLYTVGYYLFKDLRSELSISEYPYLAAMGLVLTAIAAPLTFGIRWALQRFGPSTD